MDSRFPFIFDSVIMRPKTIGYVQSHRLRLFFFVLSSCSQNLPKRNARRTQRAMMNDEQGALVTDNRKEEGGETHLYVASNTDIVLKDDQTRKSSGSFPGAVF